jgi:hypothetical protein
VGCFSLSEGSPGFRKFAMPVEYANETACGGFGSTSDGFAGDMGESLFSFIA